jgi:HD-GYP domain-containing protein (c-di-GMP phosphodiesterase class II)
MERGKAFFERALGATELVGPETFSVPCYDGTVRRLEIVLTNRLADPACGGLVANMRDVTYRDVMAAALATRDRILEAITSIAQGVLSRSWAQPTGAMLARLGEAARVSRVRLYRTPESADGVLSFSLVHEWAADAAWHSEQLVTAQPFVVQGPERWVGELRGGRAVHGLVADLHKTERRVLEQIGVVSFADVPIIVRGSLWGVLAFHECERPREWSASELDAMHTATDMLGVALAHLDIEADLERVERSGSEHRTLLEALQATAPVGFGFVDTDLRLVRCNERLAAINGGPATAQLGRQVSETLSQLWPQLEIGYRLVLRTGAVVDDAEIVGATAGDPTREHIWLTSYYPVHLADELIGVGLVMFDITDRRDAEREHDKLAHDAIGAIAAAVDARDPYTAGHQRRVGQIAAFIATELGMDHDVIEGIKLAGDIHDIGKVAVPAEILSRPGRLRPAELELVKIHPRAGAEIMAGITFPWPIADMIRQHHERFDGGGYPDGLRGEEILPGSHILHVADVVEAMASHRPYRPALGLPAALEVIRAGAGAEFEPAAAAACLRVFADGRVPPMADDPLATTAWPGLGTPAAAVTTAPG